MAEASIIIKNAYLLTLNKNRDIIKDACIVIKDDRVIDIGSDKIIAKYQADRVIDAKGRVILPGFISTHSHLFQTMLKGLGRDMTNTEKTRERIHSDKAITVELDDMMQVDEVAKVVLFLASDDAKPIMGAAIDVFGKKA